MKEKSGRIKKRLYLVAAIILLAGMGISAFIYLTADNDPGTVLGYEVIGGDVYPIRPDDSKMYRHDLEVYGGKANVLMDKFMRWFASLWHGRSLALTIACITVLISLGFFLVSYHWQSGPDSDDPD
ncbi:MAG: hypothetical protein P8013_09885 [Candidatus Sulfobium sp.]|jgi:hypothetical protein